MYGSDGVRVITGTRRRLEARVRKINQLLHSKIHLICGKNMAKKIKTVLNDIVHVVNFIKSRPLNSVFSV